MRPSAIIPPLSELCIIASWKKNTRLYRHTAYAIILKNAVINGLDHLPQDIEAKIREFLTSHTTSDSAGVAKFIDIDLIHESISDLKPHKAAWWRV